ncbi:Cytosol aminopeptidase [Tsuneonella dongtanensis]|uniref:Probable cytosol aminopeptidase n=1 Tax=Tsuneonella dongtanensis TaxID=692370 RepID=A0A1B2AGQ1_9SPHN|nr:leucyl aminopeptidase [Tsuneonella dongtanensis]ANY21333.1 Cytosol aminopeptidase [Tsuneonella dongtanensis]
MRAAPLSLLFAATALSAPAIGQDAPGHQVAPAIAANSAERPIAFSTTIPADAALVVLMSGPDVPATISLTAAEREGIAAAVASGGFAAGAGEVLSLRGVGGRPRLLVVGTGAEPSVTAIRDAAGKAAQEMKGEKAPVALVGAGSGATLAEAALGYALGQYRFDRYKTGAGAPPPSAPVTVVGEGADAARAAWHARHRGIAEGTRLTRDLATEPAGVIWPQSFVDRTRAAFAGVPGVTIEALDEAAMQRENMGAILGVGQGSRRPPRMLLVHYRGATGQPVALAGKGITFDSGGISLKDGSGMSRMKGDMSGAAAVVGTVLALATSRAPVNVVAVAALAENMPGGNAQRPGDVVRTMSGKTIEVLNTDAEGRLVLADAVEYVAARHKPAAIVDIATLTGSVIGALGDEYAGLFSRDDALAATLTKAGEASGEAVWRLPLHPNHFKDLKSDIADFQNVVEGGGPGASHGAAFIGSFVPEALPWAHVDMAGTMWASTPQPTVPKGATGFGVRLLEEFVRSFAASR